MKLTIQKQPDAPDRALLPHHFDYFLGDEEGNQVQLGMSLQGLQLTMESGKANQVILRMSLTDADLDVEALTEMKAELKRRNEEFAAQVDKDSAPKGGQQE